MKYRRKDSFNCWQNNGSWQDFNKWMEALWGGEVEYGKPNNPDITRTPDGDLIIVTRRGQMIVSAPRTEERDGEKVRIPGDWCFQSSDGEILGIDRDVFEQMFEPLPTPEKVAAEDMHLELLDIRSAVFTALGAASSCWDDLNSHGSFLATECARIGEQLLERIQAENAKFIAESNLKDDIEMTKLFDGGKDGTETVLSVLDEMGGNINWSPVDIVKALEAAGIVFYKETGGGEL